MEFDGYDPELLNDPSAPVPTVIQNPKKNQSLNSQEHSNIDPLLNQTKNIKIFKKYFKMAKMVIEQVLKINKIFENFNFFDF